LVQQRSRAAERAAAAELHREGQDMSFVLRCDDEPHHHPFFLHNSVVWHWLFALSVTFAGDKFLKPPCGPVAELQDNGAAIPLSSRNVFKSINVKFLKRFAAWRHFPVQVHPLYPKRVEIRGGAPPSPGSLVSMGTLGEARVSFSGTFRDHTDFIFFSKSAWFGRGGAALATPHEVYEVLGLEERLVRMDGMKIVVSWVPKRDKDGQDRCKQKAFANNRICWFAVQHK
jgi:hypothetical protein